MQLNENDRTALYNVWMSQKAKMQITQMEMTKRLGVSQMEFSQLLRGNAPLTMSFVSQFCQQLHVEPYNVLPTLKRQYTKGDVVVHLQSRISVDGEIQNIHVEGNQVIIDYTHQAK